MFNTRFTILHLRFGRVPVENLFFGAFVCLGRGLIAPKTAIIYFSDLRRKIEGGFSLYSDGFFNNLLPSVFSTAILLGLGIDEKLQTVAEQADQDWLQDH